MSPGGMFGLRPASQASTLSEKEKVSWSVNCSSPLSSSARAG